MKELTKRVKPKRNTRQKLQRKKNRFKLTSLSQRAEYNLKVIKFTEKITKRQVITYCLKKTFFLPIKVEGKHKLYNCKTSRKFSF